MNTRKVSEAIDQDRRRLLGAAATIALASAANLLVPSQLVAEGVGNAIRPFRVNVPEEQLADLRRRIAATRWPDRETAEEKALEKCQQFFDELCAVVAADDVVTVPGGDGRLQGRDAPRVRYSGVFNPERIPAITKGVEQRMDVAGYATAASPKAAAFHATGLLHIVVAAPSQAA